MNVFKFLVCLASWIPIAAWAQCAPGVPCGGNPSGIPPTAPGSPYAQPEYGTVPPSGNVNEESARWADRWGAIALDPDSGRAGTVTGKVSKSVASNTALSECAQHDGNNCRVILTYYNQCAAVAQPDNNGPVSSASAVDISTAEDHALGACNTRGKCSVVYSACSPAERTR